MARVLGRHLLTTSAPLPNCDANDCPNVCRTTTGRITVQGNVPGTVQSPEGEDLVELPDSVLKEAIHALGR
ncbi:hypothetical protein OHT57_19725 [Streptomyces sp. NBC_00285]